MCGPGPTPGPDTGHMTTPDTSDVPSMSGVSVSSMRVKCVQCGSQKCSAATCSKPVCYSKHYYTDTRGVSHCFGVITMNWEMPAARSIRYQLVCENCLCQWHWYLWQPCPPWGVSYNFIFLVVFTKIYFLKKYKLNKSIFIEDRCIHLLSSHPWASY